MDWKKVVSDLDGWQDQDIAPLDGTPIMVDCGGAIGVFTWEDRPECLPITFSGRPISETWIGFFIATDLTQWKKKVAVRRPRE